MKKTPHICILAEGSSLLEMSYISSVYVLQPKTAEELLYMLQFGNQHRTQHPTDANAESSRSHAVFQVTVSIGLFHQKKFGHGTSRNLWHV